MADADSTRRMNCPRCGYDQRGVAETWTESCPLEGICTECGLGFAWVEVMRPDLSEPQWCVEFAEGWGRLIRACVGTLVRSLWPWRFWSQIRMSHPIRWRRLAGYVGAMLLPFIVSYVVVQAGVAIYVWRAIDREFNDYKQQLPTLLAQTEASYQSGLRNNVTKHELERREQMVIQLRDQLQHNPVIEHSIVLAIGEAVLLPTAKRSRGKVRWGSNVGPYTAPHNLHEHMWRDLSIRGVSQRPGASVLSKMSDVLPFLPLVLLMPASLVLLPVTRRKAKVRWAHIWRAMIYGLVWPVTVILVVAWAASVSRFDFPGSDAIDNFSDVLGVPLLIITLFAWWWAVISRYLCIRFGWFVSFMLLVMNILVLSSIYFWGNELL